MAGKIDVWNSSVKSTQFGQADQTVPEQAGPYRQPHQQVRQGAVGFLVDRGAIRGISLF
jgi:hypothetical protein